MYRKRILIKRYYHPNPNKIIIKRHSLQIFENKQFEYFHFSSNSQGKGKIKKTIDSTYSLIHSECFFNIQH